ncbi:MAG: hypothetical protein NTZ59_14945 [Bacteroidetes bacterium]|nr:hypothetical protein [Bacteroidota bacterium]
MKRCDTIVTFGGAFSNHIVATSFACKENNLKSIGIIRGEEPQQLSHTLQAAKAFGMELLFIERSVYKTKQIPNIYQNTATYIIPEGGYGKLGCQGSATIYHLCFWYRNYNCRLNRIVFASSKNYRH